MAAIVLRVMKEGGFDVDGFLREHPEVHAEKVWRCGEVCAPRRVAMASSGFNACLSDAEDDAQALREALAALEPLRSALAALRALDVRVELDLGLFVGPEFSRNVTFEPARLQSLAELGVGLEVSAYACASDPEAA